MAHHHQRNHAHGVNAHRHGIACEAFDSLGIIPVFTARGMPAILGVQIGRTGSDQSHPKTHLVELTLLPS